VEGNGTLGTTMTTGGLVVHGKIMSSWVRYGGNGTCDTCEKMGNKGPKILAVVRKGSLVAIPTISRLGWPGDGGVVNGVLVEILVC
jgi:hypothetical protein